MMKSFSKAARNFAKAQDEEIAPWTLVDLTREKTVDRVVNCAALWSTTFCFVCYAEKHQEVITTRKAEYIKWRMRKC